MTKTIAELLQDLDDDTDALGQLMANNLNAMGVTGASASDGLTTLANKILDISPATITLSTNKNILSYYDSETATLTATHSWGAGQTVEVYNAVTGSKIGDMTDNDNGTYTYTYTSTGIGDISMTATAGTTESNSITIEDCLYFDTQTIDKQRYTVTSGGATISYNSNGVRIAGTQATSCLVKNTALTLPQNYIAELVLTDFNGNENPKYCGGLCFDDLLIDIQTSKLNWYIFSSITSLGNTNHTLQQGDVFRIEMNNGTMKVYINDDLKTTQTITHTGEYYNRTYRASITTTARMLTTKNLKVKPITTQ